MTIAYKCEVKMSEPSDFEHYDELTAALSKNGYDWDYDPETKSLIIDGETEVDSYDTDAVDVASDIDYILRSTANIDADIEAKTVEHEPDWDRMPGGVDYGSWN